MADGSMLPIGPLGEAARELIVRAFGPVADEFGAMISNEMKVWKAARIQRLAELWQEKMAGKAIPEEAIKQLPFGSVYRVMQAASTEDADDVLDLWAGLLANAMDPAIEINIEKVYEDILSKIGAAEVLLLKACELASRRPHVLPDQETKALVERLRALPRATRQIAYENLRRLGCVLPPNSSQQFGFSMGRLAGARENFASAAGVAAALDSVIKMQRLSSGAMEYDPIEFSGGALPMMTVTFELTQLGKHFLASCSTQPASGS